MLVANIGSIVAEFAGIAAALSLFNVPDGNRGSDAATVVILLLTRGSFGKVQYLFVAVGIGVSLAYFVSALMSPPGLGPALHVAGRAERLSARPPTGWRSSPRSAPPSRRGARPSSSRMSPTSAWVLRT